MGQFNWRCLCLRNSLLSCEDDYESPEVSGDLYLFGPALCGKLRST